MGILLLFTCLLVYTVLHCSKKQLEGMYQIQLELAKIRKELQTKADRED